MRKIMVVVGAAWGVIGSAQAARTQSEIFGTVDMAITHLQAAGRSQTGMAHSGSNISRIGFRGRESLGSGYAAGFWLEGGLQPNLGRGGAANGGLDFRRRATISMYSPYGELRLGRDDSVTFLSTLLFDPFMTNGVAGTNAFMMLGGPIQISNAVSYVLPPEIGGWYGQVQMAFGPSSTPSSGSYRGARLGYAQGAVNVAIAAARQHDSVQDSLNIANLAASYDFGVIKPSLLLAQEKRGAARVRAYQLGATAPIGAHLLRGSIAAYRVSGQRPNAGWFKYSVGYAYNFSKSTQLYASYSFVRNQSGSARAITVQGMGAPINTLGSSAQGYQLGIRKFF